MKLAFWQQLPSPHQAPFIRELAARLGPGNVTCLFSGSPDRAAPPLGLESGWAHDRIDYGGAEIANALTDDRAVQGELFATDTVHIFSSLASDSRIRRRFRDIVNRGGSVGVLSEARDWRGWKGGLRRVDSFRHEKSWKPHLSFVLGMGSMGCHWYQLCGYDEARLFDFCYAVERPAAADPHPVIEQGFRVAFVGQLVDRKRVDLLLHAMARMRDKDVSLDIVGTGPLEAKLRRLAQDLQVQDAVHFLGGLRNSEVHRVLSAADVLVLPSRWDGWGAVVNEALSNGAKVICSDFCGAADLVNDPRFGSIFRCGSLESLTGALGAMVAGGKTSLEERARIRAHSESFSGPAVAAYLLSIMEWSRGGGGQRPSAPWRTATGGVG